MARRKTKEEKNAIWWEEQRWLDKYNALAKKISIRIFVPGERRPCLLEIKRRMARAMIHYNRIRHLIDPVRPDLIVCD